MDRNGVIGREGALPWRLPNDMAYFRQTTTGHPVIMGRRTFESLPRPLPGRTNIVVSRRPGYEAAGIVPAPTLDAALTHAAAAEGGDTVFVIGGAEIYAAALPRADLLHVTRIDAEVAGDVVFPGVDWAAFRCLSVICHAADDRHAWPFRIECWERS
jgi:dihydrofolate reductase